MEQPRLAVVWTRERKRERARERERESERESVGEKKSVCVIEKSDQDLFVGNHTHTHLSV